MSLLEIVGVTSTNNIFSIAFMLMDEEKETNYTWASNCLRTTQGGYVGSYVIVTDKELALINSCANVLVIYPAFVYSEVPCFQGYRTGTKSIAANARTKSIATGVSPISTKSIVADVIY
uniref:MULE transposase domain-containing protein n=1 Tax=Lactuca sativa TaxID=4236 RepID=A0A9R1XHQ3_LACSA|nr:hypothetical protein LSAT_V11C400176800 [Lactuca sativa]